jgi:hypothetical protein
MCEEFNVRKTNRHKNRQKRVLVIESNTIYHRKQMIDPSTGRDRPASNFLMQVRTSDGKPIQPRDHS